MSGHLQRTNKFLYIFLLGWMTGCSSSNAPEAPSNHFLATNASSEHWGTLHTITGLFRDPTCSLTAKEVLELWDSRSIAANSYAPTARDPACSWSRIQFNNPTKTEQIHYIHFTKSWYALTTHLESGDGSFIRSIRGTINNQEILPVRIPPGDTITLLVRYPGNAQAFIPSFGVGEISAKHFMSINSRTSLKYLLYGFLCFPVLFFLFIYILERDKLILAYLIFLVGAALNMMSILETTPFFEFTPKLVKSIGITQRMFLLSGLISLAALIKYIHYLLDVRSWSANLHKTGQWLIAIFLLVVLYPMIFTRILEAGNYNGFLQIFRVTAFIIIIYIIWMSSRGLVLKVQFSKIFLLAFSPFLLCTLYYAIRFIIIQEYSSTSTASLILIAGFFLTILLFGVIIGVRNNLVKMEKIRLEQETQHLKDLDNFKSRFFTNFTHEFRTPLTVITGMIDQINGYQRETSMIRRNANRLLKIVNDLLDLSKLESDQLQVNWIQANVVPFLNYLVESCTSLAQAKRINLAFFSDKETIMMDYDETRLQQILMNLLSNAIKFTPEYGSVKVIAGIIIKDQYEFLQISVCDTGDGIAPADIDKIFERFYQSGETNHSEGTGIGLAMTRELTILLGGSITVNSQPGKGSCFHVKLPIHREAACRENTRRRVTESTDVLRIPDQVQNSSQPIVLLIEDNADVSEYIISCISPYYNVRHARNGKAGTDLALEIIPDVIVSDVMMPVMDGFEVCKLLKDDRRTSHIPIILLTAKATQEDKLSGLKLGADAYLTKPFNKEELILRLANMAEWSQQLRHALNSPGEYATVIEKKEAAFIEEVQDLIRKNLANEKFNTDQLCQEVAMSRTQLHRKLKALTGVSTAAFIRTLRLKQASILLQTTDLPVGEVATSVGFGDFSHFTRSFSKEFGMNPSAFRE